MYKLKSGFYLVIFLIVALTAPIGIAQDTTGFYYLSDTTSLEFNLFKTEATQNRIQPSVLPWEVQYRYISSPYFYKKGFTTIRREELELVLAKNLSFVSIHARNRSTQFMLNLTKLAALKTKYDFQRELDESIWYKNEGYSTVLRFLLERTVYSNEIYLTEFPYKFYNAQGQIDTIKVKQEIAYLERSIAAYSSQGFSPNISPTTIQFSISTGMNAYSNEFMWVSNFDLIVNNFRMRLMPEFEFIEFNSLHGQLAKRFGSLENRLHYFIGVGGRWDFSTYFPDPYIQTELDIKLFQFINWNRETLIFQRPAESVQLYLNSQYYPIENQVAIGFGIKYTICGTQPYKVIR